MKIIFNKTQFGLWLTIFLFSLLGTGQNAKAQWGLVDTVWVARPVGGEGNMYPSDNDSLFISGYAIRKTIDNSIFYLCKEWEEMYPKFMNDSTIMFTAGDSIGVINLNTKQRVKMLNCKGFLFYHNLNPYNYNPYSRYDNCVYETNEFNSRKLNLETGEVTEVPYLKGLDGSSISQDGEVLAGFDYKGQWVDGKYVYDLFFKVYSLVTGETIVPSQRITIKMQAANEFPEFVFSRDHRYLNVYFYLNSSIWDLEAKTMIKEIPRNIQLDTSRSIGYRKPIFTTDNKKIFTFKSYGHKVQGQFWDVLDSLKISLIDLQELKEKEFKFPFGTGCSANFQSFVFDDSHILCDQVYYWNGSYNANDYKFIGNSCLIKLNIDINSIQEPEQNYEGVLYPNPATEYIIVGANGRSPLRDDGVQQEIRIFDVFGKCVLTVETQNFVSLQNIDISTLSEGTYFLHAGSEVYKFMVMR